MFRPRSLKDYARQITPTPTLVFFFLFLFFYVFRPRGLKDSRTSNDSDADPSLLFFLSFFFMCFDRGCLKITPIKSLRRLPSPSFVSRRFSFSTPSFAFLCLSTPSLLRPLPYSDASRHFPFSFCADPSLLFLFSFFFYVFRPRSLKDSTRPIAPTTTLSFFSFSFFFYVFRPRSLKDSARPIAPTTTLSFFSFSFFFMCFALGRLETPAVKSRQPRP